MSKVINRTSVLAASAFVLTMVITSFIFGLEKAFLVIFSYHFPALLYAILFFGLFMLLTKTIWLSLSASTKDIYRKNKKKFQNIICLSLALFFLGFWMANHYFFDYDLSIISLSGYLGILLFGSSLTSIWIKPSKRKYLLLYSSGFILFVTLVYSSISVSSPNPPHPASKETLKSLPYAKWVPASKTIEREGVVKYNRQKSFKGLNIYHSQKSVNIYLMDMTGKILHTWSTRMNEHEEYPVAHTELCQNGDLVVNVHKKFLIRIDWHSNMKWIQNVSSHHDIGIDEKGDIFTLSHEKKVVFHSYLPIPIGEEYIVILSADGKIKKKLSLYKILKNKIPSDRFKKIAWWLINPKDFFNRIEIIVKPPIDIFSRTHDIFHSNTIEVIDRDIDDVFRKGNLLFCSRHLDLIGVIDTEEESLAWSWGEGELDWPHHPTLLENGNILIFDNGNHREYSRIVELNPYTKEIEWQYLAHPPQSFFSAERGANQRLPNDNTLITESNKGRVFEVTKDGEIVWEFYNPEIDRKEEKRATIYRMMRITDPENYAYLKDFKRE